MRALTHADTFLCPHGCPITPGAATANLVVNGVKVLLMDELNSATLACVAGPGRCNTITTVTNPASPKTKVKGKEPALQGVTLMTDRGKAMMIPAPGPHNWQLGAGGSFESGPPALECISPEERREALKQNKPPLAPGVYLGSRLLKDWPLSWSTMNKMGNPAEGRHQFLLLVTEGTGSFQEAQALGQGAMGLTLGGHNTDRIKDAVEVVVGRSDYLIAKANEKADLSAAKEWVEGIELEKSTWGSTLCRVPVPAGKKLQEFQQAMYRSYQNYLENIKHAPIEYPLIGGLLVHLYAGRCFNSNSWTNGLLHEAMARPLPPGATDLRGSDLCANNSIPPYYFRANTKRVSSAQQRREKYRQQFQSTNGPENKKMEVLTRAIVEDIRGDNFILNKEEMVLEDLRYAVTGTEPMIQAEQLNFDISLQFTRLILAVKAGYSDTVFKSNAVLTCIAGLIWGFYQDKIAPISKDLMLVMLYWKEYPVLFLAASSLGSRLSRNVLPLEKLPQEIEALLVNNPE